MAGMGGGGGGGIGGMGGGMNILGDIGGLIGGWVEKRKNAKAIAKAAKEQQALFESLDHEPEYAADYTPTFKRTESPVARAYLESFLLGQNPDATYSGDPNAKYIQAAQQRSQNTTYGTPEERAARQAAIMKETPWEVTKRPMEIDPGAPLSDKGPSGFGISRADLLKKEVDKYNNAGRR